MNNKNLHSIALVSVVLILFFTLISFSASAVPYAYIATAAGGAASVIDTATNNITATIPGEPSYGVAISPDGKRVYLTNYGNKSVSVIDTTTNTIIAAVKIGAVPESIVDPRGIAITPDGSKVYVSEDGDGSVAVINTKTNTVITEIRVGSMPQGVAVSPDGSKVYVVNQGSNTVDVINTSTNTVTTTINDNTSTNFSHGFIAVAVSPNGKKLYVTNNGYYSNELYVIDTDANTIITKVKVGTSPQGVAVSPDGSKVYVTNSGSGTVSVVDTSTNKVLGTIPVGNGTSGVSVTPDGKKVYVANQLSNTLTVIDTATNKVITTINSLNNPVAFGQFIGPDIIKPTLPVANFSSNITQGYAPLSVQFKDLSTNATSWKWTFGDGTNSTIQNPVHEYLTAGNYTVSLTSTNTAGNNTTTKTDYIKVTAPTSPPVANFTSNITSGYAPLAIKFTSTSTGSPIEWKWNFSDGSPIIDGTTPDYQNPVHVYSKAGVYTVVHTAINAYGRSTLTKTNYIKVTAPTSKPVANFTSNVTSGFAPLNVAFTDKSSGSPTSWKWIFGDGTNSTTKSPIHKYLKAGNYTVSLTVNNSAGSNTLTKTSYIKAKAVIKPVANFTSNVTSGYVPLNVAFTDKSTNNPTSWKWVFGDGTNSTVKNPIHKYSKVGNFTVSLTATNTAGSNTITKTNYIKVKSR